MIRALIADDEPLARERVRELLLQRSDVTIAGEARDGEEAVRLIHDTAPDLVLLDVQMPEMDGFEVLASLGNEKPPAIVFITAFDEYAVRAFEVRAVDYLVKPFHRARFHEAIDRAIAKPPSSDAIRELLAQMQRPSLTRFVVRSADGIYFVKAADVLWIESAGNYVKLHTKSGDHIARTSLRELEKRLDPALFVRVHRSAVVNVDCIKKLEPYFHGEYIITLKDGSRLTSSRSYSAKLRELLE
ncbi:MAG TPA: LytTR family DNA-binding domain-containing protein [Thermoanaerobaculia bacterium]|nr:LytTR family DNA-binding domain-containing protein [Thermoanaerobaculia bacterium]